MDLLKKRRAGHRGHVTSLTQSLYTKLCEHDPDIETIEMYHNELQRQRDLIEQLDAEILLVTDNEVKEISEASEIIMKISLAMGKAKKLLSQSANETCSRTSVKHNSVKLPQLVLAKFSGNPLDWINFWELFRSAVHIREDIPNSIKFQYLLGQLEGDAAQLLAGFSHSEREYVEAIDLLTKTYGQENILLQARLNALFDLEHPDATSESLSNFRSAFEGHLRVLKAQGSDVDSAGYVFAHLLLRKLPMSTRDNLNRANGPAAWTLDNLRNRIKDEIQHLSSLDDVSKTICTNKLYNFDSDINSRNLNSASFHALSKSTKVFCRFCNGPHYALNCERYWNCETRKKRVMELKICYNCLYKNHSVSQCLNNNRCQNCDKKHHTSLCNQKDLNFLNKNTKFSQNLAYTRNDKESGHNSSSMTISSSMINTTTTSLLPTADIQLQNGHIFEKTKALFDCGSMKTFLLRSIAEKLKLDILKSETLQIDGFNSTGNCESYDVVKVSVNTHEGPIQMISYIVNSLPSRITMNERGKITNYCKNIGYQLADVSNENSFSLGVIIGVDNMHKFIYGTHVCDNVFSLPSKLGTLLLGTFPRENLSQTSASVLHINALDSQNFMDEISNMWKLEAVGIQEPTASEGEALNNFRTNISFKDGKYITRLPWKDENVDLPPNKNMAYRRLCSLWKNLAENREKLECYDGIIKDQLSRDFVEKIEDCSYDGNRVHYLPHHCIEKDSATTPLRVVFDCSAKTKNSLSLNDCLMTGPSLVTDLVSILLRFRLHKYAAVADIEKAFLMVGLNVEDRDACRFLWPEDVHDPNSKILTYRFKVVLFGSTASQFLLNSTIIFHLSKFNNETAKTILRNVYIDNVIATFNCENDLYKFYQESKIMLSSGGFNLREWCSNSKDFMDKLSLTDKMEKEMINVLGLKWNVDADTLSIQSCAPAILEKLTKRQIVSNVSKTFDPLGFLLPITVAGKILIQDLWRSKCGWDENLPENFALNWANYVKNLSEIELELTRSISDYNDPNLHVFADASARCYGAVAYLVEYEKSDFVMAKSRLCPIKAPSLPQLELTALNMAARMANFLIDTFSQEIKVKNIFYGLIVKLS